MYKTCFSVIVGLSVFFLYKTSDIFTNTSYANQKTNSDRFDGYAMTHIEAEFGCVQRNDTSVCLENCGQNDQNEGCHAFDICIDSIQMCNGVLDFLNISQYEHDVENHCRDKPYRLPHFYDELFCRQRWIGVYISIFSTGAISIMCCVATWIFTVDTLGIVFQHAKNTFRRIFYAQTLMQ